MDNSLKVKVNSDETTGVITVKANDKALVAIAHAANKLLVEDEKRVWVTEALILQRTT
jgi:hypothetical protein